MLAGCQMYVFIDLVFVAKIDPPKACPTPAESTGTKPVEVDRVFSGETYTYECEEGMVPDGDSAKMTISCNNGEWSGTPPSCICKILVYLFTPVAYT